MRIAVVPDVHGNPPALRAVLEDVRGRGPRPHVMQGGTPAARYAMLQRGSGSWHAQLLAVEYDPATSAALARERDFDERVGALRDGRLPP